MASRAGFARRRWWATLLAVETTDRADGPLSESIAAEAAFGEDLAKHLQAIAARDLDEFDATVADEVVLVTADGDVITGREPFLERHREWFATPGWKLDVKELHRRVGADLATCVLALDYRPDGDGGRVVPSVLHLTFVRRGERWLMAEDQNTPVR
jgi:uncharacterized protein (TIGR02246 family)